MSHNQLSCSMSSSTLRTWLATLALNLPGLIVLDKLFSIPLLGSFDVVVHGLSCRVVHIDRLSSLARPGAAPALSLHLSLSGMDCTSTRSGIANTGWPKISFEAPVSFNLSSFDLHATMVLGIESGLPANVTMRDTRIRLGVLHARVTLESF